MQLSERLEGVARLARTARRLADVGTDHGYLPIALVERGQLEHAIAMDVNRGPLARAGEHIMRYGMQGKIELRLSDGVAALRPGEADTVVIAGMGGGLMGKILAAGAEVLGSVDTLVLQPQSELYWFRQFLHESGYCIAEEAMVKDEGKYYPMMRVCHGAQERWTEAEYRYGRLLLQSHNEVLQEFLEREAHTYKLIWSGLQGQPGARIGKRRAEVEMRLRLIEEAKEEMK